MQSWQCRGAAVQQRLVTRVLSLTWVYITLMVTGVAKDAEQAVSWCRRAAEAGNADAQYQLGLLLR